MKNFEFKSQVATTREQSERLLKLGLKKETADCQYAALIMDWKGNPISNPKWRFYDHNKGFIVQNFEQMECIPAWSLNRLIEILGPHRLPIHFRKKGRVDITVSFINPVHSGRSGYNYYDSIIDCIAWLIDQGYSYINKDYLEEKK